MDHKVDREVQVKEGFQGPMENRVKLDHKEFKGCPDHWDLLEIKEFKENQDKMVNLAQLDHQVQEVILGKMDHKAHKVLLDPPERTVKEDLQELWVPEVSKDCRVHQAVKGLQEKMVSLEY